MKKPKKIGCPIYITRPLIPRLSEVSRYLKIVFDSKILTNNGIQVQTLEHELSKILKTDNLLLFNNGTIALMIGIKALELSGEVITTPFTFPATINCLLWNNLTPVFCDIENRSMNIDPDKIEKLITPNTCAILAVHVFGNPCDVIKINKIAKKYHLKVIYDAAHAFETEVNGKAIGTYGDLSMFSFHPTKLFHTCEGGALVFKDDKIKDNANLLRNFGIKNEDEVLLPGINGKMNEIQAVIGRIVLNDRIKERERRSIISEYYIRELRKISGIEPGVLMDGVSKSSLQYFPIRIKEIEYGKSRDWVYNELKKYNIFARKYFYPLCSNYPYLCDLKSSKTSNLKIANRVVNEVLCLPFYGALKVSNIKRIVEMFNYFKNNG